MARERTSMSNEKGDKMENKNPYNETNFKIQVISENNFVVRSDSERFGKNEITFQGISYVECLKYIEGKGENRKPSYYVIKDLASWRHDVWEGKERPEYSKVERFETVEDAIIKFKAYQDMGYLREVVINPDNNTHMRRLALGVSLGNGELDLLHVEHEKVLLLSDATAERKDGYEWVMTNSAFIEDLNLIVSAIRVDEYSYYRESTIEELAAERKAFLEEKYPEEEHTWEEALAMAKEFVRRRPNYLKNRHVNERVPFENFNPPYLSKEDKSMQIVG